MITRYLFFILFFFSPCALWAQQHDAAYYGFRHLTMVYQGDTVNILVKSRKGEENQRKPLFFFCQGSLPVPLIVTYEPDQPKNVYGVFPFNTDSLTVSYHLVIVGKPAVPVITAEKSLGKDLNYFDNTGKFPSGYIERNLLDYYVNRNKAVVRFLQRQRWVAKDQLVAAGHSEGSTIAARLASEDPAVTALIYSGGNPLGRIMSLIERSRALETDSTRYAEMDFQNWEKVVANQESMDATSGDTYKVTYQFSAPPINYIIKLKIPVLVTYGTKDASAPFNDYMRVETIRNGLRNFSFKAYIGTEHNFFPLKPDNTVNYDIFNWDKVGEDWRKWLAGLH